MSFEWTRTTWGEVATLEYGKALRDYQNIVEGFPVYGTNGPIGFHDTALCKTPGVVIGRKGAYRGVHYSSRPFFVIDTAFYLKPKAEIDMRWAYYALLTCDINNMDSGYDSVNE
jgi:type I restriction enzyme S subunit